MPHRIMLFLIYGGRMKKKKKETLLEKIKKIEFRVSYLVIAVILAVVLRYWGENTVTLLQKKVPIVTDTEISKDELEKYIQTKQQYLDENITISPYIIESENFEEVLNDNIHEWFLVRNWRPGRFFYVDDRVKQIVSLLDEQIRNLDEARRLEEQANSLNKIFYEISPEQAEKAAYFSKQAEVIRYYLNRNIRNAGISKKEENLVKEDLDILEAITKR